MQWKKFYKKWQGALFILISIPALVIAIVSVLPLFPAHAIALITFGSLMMLCGIALLILAIYQSIYPPPSTLQPQLDEIEDLEEELSEQEKHLDELEKIFLYERNRFEERKQHRIQQEILIKQDNQLVRVQVETKADENQSNYIRPDVPASPIKRPPKIKLYSKFDLFFAEPPNDDECKNYAQRVSLLELKNKEIDERKENLSQALQQLLEEQESFNSRINSP